MSNEAAPVSYWERRQSALYYKVVRSLVDGLGTDANSILDVGSAGCPYLDWFSGIPDRASVDLRKPYAAPGIRSFTSDFLNWEPDKKYDIVTCLQVLEHVPDAKAFAKKLLSSGEIIVVSVPYKWRKGHEKTHVHDPVDEAKMMRWFERRPNYEYVCQEVDNDLKRLIQVYEPDLQPWKSLSHRRHQLNHRNDAQSSRKPRTLRSRLKKLLKRYTH